MATTSEIQVTEAYIGLLGRAPDPAGLAYWVKQLDDAIAAGQDATLALKKLTNDITLSTEWSTGIGTNDASTQTGADAVVAAMYTNLFGRAATTADKAYWSAELLAGTTTASEMAVQLIQGASTTDAGTLGFKQEAATYYVGTVTDSDFNTTNAASAVSTVDSPLTLLASKAATDALATGSGITVALTTADDSASLAMTLGDDTVTGTVGTGATYAGGTDALSDASTTDADTLTLTGDAAFAFGTVKNVETVNVNLAKQVGAAFALTGVNNVTGSSQINIDVADTVTISGVSVTGETDVTLAGGIAADVSTTDVTTIGGALATGTAEAALTITGDADLNTVTLTSVADSATNIVLGDNDSTVSLDGTAATNDAASVSTSGKSAVSLSAGNPVESITLSGSTAAVDYTITNAAAAATTYTITGSQDVELTGATSMFTGQTFVQSGTGSLSLELSAVDTLSVWGAGVIAGGIKLAADQGANADTFTTTAGTPFSVTVDQTAGATHTFDANDASTGSTLTINVNENTGTIKTEDYEVISLATNDVQAVTIAAMDVDANDSTVAIVGANDITITGNYAGAGDLTMSGKKLVLGGTVTADPTNDVNSGDVTMTASDDIAVTGKITAQNDIVLTATNDIAMANSDAANGSMTVTGDSFVATGLVDAQNDISITTTANDVDLADVTSSNGSLTVKGATIDNTAAISVATGTVTLTATNDAATSNIDGTITALKVTLADGKFDGTGQLITADEIVVSGDTDVTASTLATDSIAITSTNDVTISLITEKDAGAGFVVAGSAATGDISITTDATATNAGNATIYTGSGNDTVTMDDPNTTFTVTTNGNTGTELINADNFATGSSINSGDGDDTVDIDETTAGVLTVNTGAGNDTVNLADNAVTGTFDLGAGDTDKVVLQETGGISYADTLGLKNIEILDISAGDATFNADDLTSNDATFKLTGNGADTLIVTGLATAETIDLSGITADALGTADIQIDGNAGNDVITGSTNIVNVISGDGDADTIVGGAAGDTLDGDAGDDTITAGEGADTVNGGAGTDTINVSESAAAEDVIKSGSGFDTIVGFDFGGTGTDDDIEFDVSDMQDTGEAAITGTTTIVLSELGGAALGTEAVTLTTTATVQDLQGLTTHILVLNSNIADTDALEVALEAGGTHQLTTGSDAAGRLDDDDGILVLYDDGTDSYLAVVVNTSGGAVDNTTFGAGDLTAVNLVKFTGVSDATSFAAADFDALVG